MLSDNHVKYKSLGYLIDRFKRMSPVGKILSNVMDALLHGQLEYSETWEDLRFPANTQKINPATIYPEYDYVLGGLIFRKTATDTTFMVAQLPHGWKEGSDLKPHVHWTKTTSAAGTVFWKLKYKWISIGGTPDALWTELTGYTPSVSDSNTADKHALTALGVIPGTNKKVSDMLILQLSRIHNDANDTYATDARLLEFDIHYQVDGHGSILEYSKD